MTISAHLNHLAIQAIVPENVSPALSTVDATRSFAQNFDNVASFTPETPGGMA